MSSRVQSRKNALRTDHQYHQGKVPQPASQETVSCKASPQQIEDKAHDWVTNQVWVIQFDNSREVCVERAIIVLDEVLHEKIDSSHFLDCQPRAP